MITNPPFLLSSLTPVLANYLYLPGRAGGQVAYGGTASGDNLILHSGTVENGYISLGDLDAIKGIRYSEGTGQFAIGKYPVGYGSDYYKLVVIDDQSLAGGFGYIDDQGNQVAGIQIFPSAGTNYPYIQFGDIGGVANHTTFTLNDAQKQIYFYADNYIYFGNNAGNFLIEVQPLSNTMRIYGGTSFGNLYLDKMKVKAVSTTQTSLIVEAITSQTSKLQTWQDTSANVGAYMDVNFNFYAKTLSFLEGGSTPTYRTIFQGGDQAADLTYTWPTAYPGSSGYALTATTGGVMSWTAMSGGSPGGSDTYVQFNDSGSFGGDAGLVYNKTTDVLTIAGGLIVGTQPDYTFSNVTTNRTLDADSTTLTIADVLDILGTYGVDLQTIKLFQ